MLHWDGTAWSQRQVPAGSYVLESVSASGPGDAWAVAYDTADFARSVILRWDGHSWTTVPAPSPGSGDNILGGVADISPASAVAVGRSEDRPPTRWTAPG